MPAGEKWRIEIPRHRGFAPKWFENTYPEYGNKAQAGNMKNVSLMDPSVLSPGPGVATLTDGDEAGAVTTLLKGILRQAVATNVSYGIGGAKLYKFSATAVTNAGDWPHTIDKAAVTGELGEDVCHYQGKLLYSYNHSGSAGDIGMFDLTSTFDDDYWTATLAGTALSDAVHQMIHGGDDVVYITNGQYIANLNGTTENHQALDFWQNAVAASLTWNYNRVVAAVNRPAITGANVNQSAVYKWNGYSSSWEGDPIEVNGRIGALFTKNGLTYIWWETFMEDGSTVLVFGIVAGSTVEPIATFSGSLPLYYQVGEIGNYVVWMSAEKMFCYGPLDGELPVDLTYLMTPTNTNTIGGIAAPFGEIMIASFNGTAAYDLQKESGYAVDSYYQTMQFPTSGRHAKSIVDTIIMNVDVLATGGRVDLTLTDNKGTSLWTDSLSFATDGAVTKKIFHPRATGENFNLKYDHTNGSATNPIKIRSTIIEGRNIPST